MQERKVGFWRQYEEPFETPMGFVIDRVKPGQAIDFVLGIKALAATISQINPDVIFLPERGAMPLWWSAREFLQAQSDSNLPRIVNLSTGEGVDNITGRNFGIKDDQKGEVIKQQIQILLDQGFKITRPLLIDEVHTGSTLTHAARHLSSAFAEFGIPEDLRILAIQDNRKKILQRKKYHGFVRLVTNALPIYQTSMLTIPLFYVDRQSMLNHLIRPETANPDRSHLMTMTMHNTDAEQTFRNLVLAVMHPKILKNIVDNTPASTQDIDNQSSAIYARLTDWLESLRSELQNPEQVTNWFKELSSHALEHGIE